MGADQDDRPVESDQDAPLTDRPVGSGQADCPVGAGQDVPLSVRPAGAYDDEPLSVR